MDKRADSVLGSPASSHGDSQASKHVDHSPTRRSKKSTPLTTIRAPIESNVLSSADPTSDASELEQAEVTSDSGFLTEDNKAVMRELQSKQQLEVLDAIDQLRREGINNDIDIPQIVVCGEQSSGKSAVLEAISHLPFPSGSNITTTFPTELVLRRCEGTSLRVAIQPHEARSDKHRALLATFSSTSACISDLKEIHAKVGSLLKQCDGNAKVFRDLLRIEVSGPEQPHLTLVDLPGLIDFSTNASSTDDATEIRSLVESWLSSRRTIVLAVVKASNDLETQKVMRIIGELKCAGRTLGIITHPDGATSHDARRTWVQNAKNETVALGLGWHIVCNQAHDVQDRSFSTRDMKETEILASSPWVQLPQSARGIKALRRKLSENLLRVIQTELPTLLTEMTLHLARCKQILKDMGKPRDNLDKQRQYLASLSEQIHRLLEAAIRADYDASYAYAFFAADESRQLRDHVRTVLERFSTDMQLQNAWRVLPEASIASSHGSSNSREGTAAHGDQALPGNTALAASSQNPTSEESASGATSASTIPFKEACERIGLMMATLRGYDLPGTIPRGATRRIFSWQSAQWRTFGEHYLYACFTIVTDKVRQAFTHAAGPHTGELLWQHFGRPFFDAVRDGLEAKHEEVLWPYVSAPPMTYRIHLINRMAPSTLEEQDIECNPWLRHARALRLPEHQVMAAKALDDADVYYRVALETFIENFCILVVERGLLSRVPEVISPAIVSCLPAETVTILAQEPHDMEEQRRLAVRQAGFLQETIDVCQRYSAVWASD